MRQPFRSRCPPCSKGLAAVIPYALVTLVPGIGAFWFGTNALNAGDRTGRIPSRIGLAWGAVVMGGVLFLFLG